MLLVHENKKSYHFQHFQRIFTIFLLILELIQLGAYFTVISFNLQSDVSLESWFMK